MTRHEATGFTSLDMEPTNVFDLQASASASAWAPVPDKVGAAGASARREYERRKAKDEERLRQKWGMLGGIAVALSDEKQITQA